MQRSFTRKKNRNVLRFAPAFLALFFLTGNLKAQTFINGNLTTGPTTLSGTAAPAGFVWSELGNVAGNTTVSNDLLGSAANTAFTLADDFTVPAGQTWTISKMYFYFVQAAQTATSPITNVRVQIHNANPSLGPTTVVFGDLTTNRLFSTGPALAFRTGNTIAPATRAPRVDIPIWEAVVTVNAVLTAGTYWVEFSSGLANQFSVLSTVAGTRTQAGVNAIQKTVSSGAWAPLIDDGNPVGNPAPQDVFYKIDFGTSACTGTPAPGNTLSTLNAVCATTPFRLSLENATPGSGVTYQWQSGPSATGPFTNIAGASANNSTLVLTQATATFYRCAVTCGGNTGHSTPRQVSMNAAADCYCIPPNTDCTDDDIITNVTLGTLNNTSGCSAPTGYTNFTGAAGVAVPDMIIGAPNTISVKGGTGFSRAVAVWIDYDRNGVFDATEFTPIFAGAASPLPHTGSINVPAGLTTGTTRMRVRWKTGTSQFTSGQACTNPSTFGETEDYAVNLAPCVQGVFTTLPANKSVQCSGTTTFTVAATGSLLTYSWQYRTSASSPWLTVPNAAPYSGATSTTLTLTNVTSTMDGYQYRALITGPCTAVDFSSPPATLTVTPLVATVTPTSATICLGGIQKIELTNVVSPVKTIDESFNTAIPLPAGWAQQNLSNPLGTTNWFQGAIDVFTSHSGAPNAYMAANFRNTGTIGTISNWLFLPAITIKNGDQFSFWTRVPLDNSTGQVEFPDRLQVRMSTNGASTNVGASETSVGDYTNLLLDINPSLNKTDYPSSWTQFTVTISGVPAPVTGRIAFRYFVTNGGTGAAAVNSNYIGIDDVVYASNGVPEGVWTANPAAPNTMFTDAAATVPYVAGALANAIWVKPTVNTSYSVVYSTTTPCVSAPTTVPVTVVTPVSAPVAPANRTACVGGSVTFTTSATGGPLTYQWQVSTNGGASFTNLANAAGTVAGATTNTLTLSGLTATMNNNQYRAVISAPPCAGSTVNTTAAVLTVNPIPVITIAAPVTQLVPGGSTTITATSTTAGLTYVWSRNGAVNGLTGSPITVNIDSLGTYRVTGTLPGVSGCAGQSNSLVISAQTSDRLWIYPNPTDGQFQVRLYYDATSAPERREFAIFNADGQQVATRSLDIIRGMSPYVQTNFDLRHLAAGTYVVKVTEKRTGKIVAGLIVIQ